MGCVIGVVRGVVYVVDSEVRFWGESDVYLGVDAGGLIFGD